MMNSLFRGKKCEESVFYIVSKTRDWKIDYWIIATDVDGSPNVYVKIEGEIKIVLIFSV